MAQVKPNARARDARARFSFNTMAFLSIELQGVGEKPRREAASRKATIRYAGPEVHKESTSSTPGTGFSSEYRAREVHAQIRPPARGTRPGVLGGAARP